MNTPILKYGHTKSYMVLSINALKMTKSTMGADTYSSTANRDAMKVMPRGMTVQIFTARLAAGDVIDLSKASTTHMAASQTIAATQRYQAMA